VTGLSLHLAPQTHWPWLVAAALLFAALARWSYRFSAPPLPALARRALAALRIVAIVLLLALLAQPVLERARGAEARLVVLLDRSRSMDFAVRPGGESRAAAAAHATEALRRALRGRAGVEVLPFGATLGADSGDAARAATALGDALGQLAASPAGQRATGVVVVSDGAVNAGADPVAAARALGLPVNVLPIGGSPGADRVITAVEAPPDGQVGHSEPVRVHVMSGEPRGRAIPVRLLENGRELAHGTATSAGPGAEAIAELDVTPRASGLAIWTARADTLAGEPSTANNERSVGLEIAPGRIGVLILSAGLNWDLTFVRRALIGDSSLAVNTWTHDSGRWRGLSPTGAARAADALPSSADLRGQAVVVLDGITPADVSADFDRALSAWARDGGGLLVMGGPPPGLSRYRAGALGADLAVRFAPEQFARSAAPAPTDQAGDLAAWDDDPVRGQMAWRNAAPLSDLVPLSPGAGDRVLIAAAGPGPPLVLARRLGRGQAVLVNGTGLWRWSLSPTDELAGERGRRLWRRLVRWLAEPVQGEPVRVKPERWVTAAGEPVRLNATLQDTAFRPLAGARVEGELTAPDGSSRPLRFEPFQAGLYVATLAPPPPGRYRVTVRGRSARGDVEIGHSSAEFAVDRWGLEIAESDPDTATLGAIARATGGLVLSGAKAGGAAGDLARRALSRARPVQTRLWESPWMFALVVGALGVEWAWRRRRGLP